LGARLTATGTTIEKPLCLPSEKRRQDRATDNDQAEGLSCPINVIGPTFGCN
jgi:hypothetical protein